MESGLIIIPFRLTNADLSRAMRYYFSTVHWLNAVDRPLGDSIEELKKRVHLILETPAGEPAAQVSAQNTTPETAQPAPAASATEAAPQNQQPHPEPAKEPVSRPQSKPVSPPPMLDPTPVPNTWDSMPVSDYLGLEIRYGSASWITTTQDISKPLTRNIPLSEAALANIPAGKRISRTTEEILKYIMKRGRTGKAPQVCAATIPCMSPGDFAQFNLTANSLNIPSATVIKRVSAAALGLMYSAPEGQRNDDIIIVDLTDTGCEIAVAEMTDGIVEMYTTVQRHLTAGTTPTFEMLRDDIFRALDRCKMTNIGHIHVSASIPSSFHQKLQEMFHIPCVRMAPDIVLKGTMVLGAIRMGYIRDMILLDATDYSVCVGTVPLLTDDVTFPAASKAVEVNYNTGRADHCLELSIMKTSATNNERPLSLKLSIQDILSQDPGLRIQKLKITQYINNEGKLNITVRNAHSGAEKCFNWESVRELIIKSIS